MSISENKLQDRNFVGALLAWVPSLLWMGILFYLSSRSTLPSPPDPIWNIILKKLGHVAAYAVLAVLNLRALRYRHRAGPREYGMAWGLAVLYAVTDEVHQGFVPGRHPTLTDWLFDALGAILGLILMAKWARESHPGVPADR